MRAAIALCAAALVASACAKSRAPEILSPDSVGVRIGTIDAVALDAALKSAPRTLTGRTEFLVDLLWQAGCLGESVVQPLRSAGASNPDVVCSLPGRTQHHIVVAAHLEDDDRDDGAPRHWTGVALLPFLYRALASTPREHTFVLVAFGKSPRRNVRETLERLGPPFSEDVRAIVDLQHIGPAEVWFSSSDAGLRRDFLASTLAVDRPLMSLRSFPPVHAGGGPHVPSIAIAAAPPVRARRPAREVEQLPAVEASPDVPGGFHAVARLVALYLGYLDETLRLRAEPRAPAGPAETPAAR